MGQQWGDMIRTFRHRPFRLGEHLERLQLGVDALRIAAAPSRTEWEAAVEQVVSHNTGLIPTDSDLGIIVFATAGWNATYLAGDAERPACTWGVHTFPLPFASWAEKMRKGQRLIVPKGQAIPPICIDPTIKWRSRLHWYLADVEARQSDAQASAVLVDANGHLTETSSGNLFIVNDGSILTPRQRETLAGVSRSVVFEIAEQLDIPTNYYDLVPLDAKYATEAFTSSTSYGLMPVASINGHKVNGPIPGPVYSRLMEAWNELVGVNIIEQILGESTETP